MGGSVQKQYRDLLGKPLIYYALLAFENSSIDEIVLVTGKGELDYCRREIVEKNGFSKVSHLVEGGKERCHSVYEGLKALTDCRYVLIHDGARPCVAEELIERTLLSVKEYPACVTAMPVKDTIKVANPEGFAAFTPDLNSLWLIQTPQAFEYELIWKAYEKLMSSEEYQQNVTDDAMVAETMTGRKVKLIAGDYSNIKVTTPEDMDVAEVLMKRNWRKTGEAGK